MSDEPTAPEAMCLYAWIGVDDGPGPRSAEFGIKQALAPAGMIPMVACKEEKMTQQFIIDQMKMVSQMTGLPRMLVRFTFERVIKTVEP